MRKLQRLVDHRLVGNRAAALDPAGGGQEDLRRCVVDALGQFERGEAAKHDGGEHGEDRLGDHRHVDDDPVALAHPERGEHGSDTAGFGEKFGIAVTADRRGDRAVIDQGDGIAAPCGNVAV